MFCFAQVTLDIFIPEAKTKFDVWLHYFIIKDAITDTMLFFMAFITFTHVHGVAKALACFLVFITGGSFIDKIIFNLNQYLYSDFLLIVLSTAFSIHMYFTKWKI